MKYLIMCPCGKQIFTVSSKVNRKKYCSKKCFYKFRTRPQGLKYILHKENPTWFKKGLIPWSKGTKGILKANSGSIKRGEHKGIKTEFKKGMNLEERNKNWKGKNVGYFGLHTWVQRKLGIARKCEVCEITKDKRKVHWANKSRKYKRDLSDWVSLCSKCHGKYDKGHRDNIKKIWPSTQ